MKKITLLLAFILLIACNNTVSFADKVGHNFDVTEFGAYGNGVNDDTAAITKALDAANSGKAKTVYFPRGTYLISSTLYYGSHISFIGDGIGKTILKASDHFYTDKKYEAVYWGMIAPKVVGNDNMSLSNMTIDGNRNNQDKPMFGFFAYGGSNFKITDVLFDHINGIGVGFAGIVKNSVVRDTRVLYSGGYLPGLWCGDKHETYQVEGDTILFDHVESSYSDLDGFIMNCPNVTVTNSRFTHNGLNKNPSSGALGAGGIYSDWTYANIKLINNYISDNTEFGINITSTDSILSKNTIENNALSGINLRVGAKNVIISDNITKNNGNSSTTVKAYSKSGISLDGVERVNITGNISIDDRTTPTQRYGIQQFDFRKKSQHISQTGNILMPNVLGETNF